MNHLKSLTLAAIAFGAVAVTPAHAALHWDSWTGAHLTPADQPSFSAPGATSWTLRSDELVNGDANGAYITLPQAPGSAILDGYFYTLFTTPTLNLTSNSLESNTGYLRLTIDASVGFDADRFDITFGGFLGTLVDFDSSNIGQVPTPIGPQDTIRSTFLWEIDVLDANSPLTIDFNLGMHNAVFGIYVGTSDTTISGVLPAPIPEPSTYALLAAGAAGAALLRRRKM